MKHPLQNVPDCSIFLLAKAYQKAHHIFKQYLAEFDITTMQHLVLEALWIQEGATAAEMCKWLILDKATISGIVDRMVDAGWLLKKRDPDDRRALRLYPTDQANKIKDDLIKAREDANAQILEGFSDQEQVLFKRLLKDLVLLFPDRLAY